MNIIDKIRKIRADIRMAQAKQRRVNTLYESIYAAAARHLDAQWTCPDSQRESVRSMGNSPLFYALAKAYRQEYPDSASRKIGVHALQCEALRRLLEEQAGVVLP